MNSTIHSGCLMRADTGTRLDTGAQGANSMHAEAWRGLGLHTARGRGAWRGWGTFGLRGVDILGNKFLF